MQETLLNYESDMSSLLSDEQKESLFNESSSETLLNLNAPQDLDTSSPSNEIEAEVERQRLIEEHNKRVLKSPEYQAKVIYEQHIAAMQAQGTYYTGPQKKTIYRQILRKAKKGRYDYLFDEEKQKRRAEKMREKFDKLNNPQVIHSVDEIPEEAQERLKEMVNEEPWNDLKPKN